MTPLATKLLEMDLSFPGTEPQDQPLSRPVFKRKLFALADPVFQEHGFSLVPKTTGSRDPGGNWSPWTTWSNGSTDVWFAMVNGYPANWMSRSAKSEEFPISVAGVQQGVDALTLLLPRLVQSGT